MSCRAWAVSDPLTRKHKLGYVSVSSAECWSAQWLAVNGDYNYCEYCTMRRGGERRRRTSSVLWRGRERRRQCLTRLGARIQRPQKSNRVVVFGSRYRVIVRVLRYECATAVGPAWFKRYVKKKSVDRSDQFNEQKVRTFFVSSGSWVSVDTSKYLKIF